MRSLRKSDTATRTRALIAQILQMKEKRVRRDHRCLGRASCCCGHISASRSNGVRSSAILFVLWSMLEFVECDERKMEIWRADGEKRKVP